MNIKNYLIEAVFTFKNIDHLPLSKSKYPELYQEYIDKIQTLFDNKLENLVIKHISVSPSGDYKTMVSIRYSTSETGGNYVLINLKTLDIKYR